LVKGNESCANICLLTMDQKEARRRYEMLVAAVKAAIDAADPAGLLKTGSPADEYDPEVGTIVPRVAKAANVAEVQKIVLDEFERWFGSESAGVVAESDAPARDIWPAVLKFRGGE
jgi:hypothetical protein